MPPRSSRVQQRAAAAQAGGVGGQDHAYRMVIEHRYRELAKLRSSLRQSSYALMVLAALHVTLNRSLLLAPEARLHLAGSSLLLVLPAVTLSALGVRSVSTLLTVLNVVVGCTAAAALTATQVLALRIKEGGPLQADLRTAGGAAAGLAALAAIFEVRTARRFITARNSMSRAVAASRK